MEGFKISTANSMPGIDLKSLSRGEISGANEDLSTESFKDTLSAALSKVNEMQKSADIKMQKVATGESNNISEVMIAAEKADIALKLMMSVRNKMIDAYQEIMRMQL